MAAQRRECQALIDAPSGSVWAARPGAAWVVILGIWAAWGSAFSLGCQAGGPAGSVLHEPGADSKLGRGARLYAAHCAACHGREGLGDGPAAIALRVRPRSFVREPFRYVSSMDGAPMEADLVETIRDGRRFGEMPAHQYLPDTDIEALSEYVRSRAARGWMQRLRSDAGMGQELSEQELEEIARERVTGAEPIEVRLPDPSFRPDTQVGRKLYMEACASCHGPTGRGDGLERPTDELGRPIAVRDLTSGEFRCGTELTEIFERIRCGVPGTPMPAQFALSDEQIWQLVYYVRFLTGLR